MRKLKRSTYAIYGLGTSSVRVLVIQDGKFTKVASDLQRDVQTRSNGENRNYRFWENAFDIIGRRDNWCGSSRGGGRDDLRPGRIGDVNVDGVNVADTITKIHDIDSWLSANFETGSVIYLKIRNRWLKFTVLPWWRIQVEVIVRMAFVETIERALKQSAE